ncbi:hypothetical protein, partial [Streptomyces sp. NPDC006183]|uniref:hypothetical protein n=1 Tax=Streptomyces sp. NPDC006183 TaxID=3154580 RepID=UPI0033B64A2F
MLKRSASTQRGFESAANEASSPARSAGDEWLAQRATSAPAERERNVPDLGHFVTHSEDAPA